MGGEISVWKREWHLEFCMKYFVREILKIEKRASCLWRLILAVCAVIVFCLCQGRVEHLQMWRWCVQNENVGKGWLWTANRQMTKFLSSIALFENELIYQYHLLQSGGSQGSCNISCNQCHMETGQQKTCWPSMLPHDQQSRPSCGKCHSTTTEAGHGTCSLGFSPQRELLGSQPLRCVSQWCRQHA